MSTNNNSPLFSPKTDAVLGFGGALYFWQFSTMDAFLGVSIEVIAIAFLLLGLGGLLTIPDE